MTGGFLHMGGYAAFVWPSFAITALVMAGLLAASVRAFRRAAGELAKLEGETPEL